ncbi:MAG TPA: pantoate--beta-alanine ligase [Chitinophagaceae bacterium]|nr:MAG: pantothenate synthetase [Bacteroidetes bacterium OLB11]HMN32827.1 pantoate--beta-alanine ligase [Chitinophagaceae bacterium]
MYIIQTKNKLLEILFKKQVGFVPTMGALHRGHLNLIQNSKNENPFTVCSIFVNPTQFNNTNDFIHYPKTIENDIELLYSIGCDFLFLPTTSEMYPDGIHSKNDYPLGEMENVFEGYFRPGHFQGVCTIVDKLIQCVLPNNLYLGEKDFQQCLVIKKLLDYIQSNTQIKICPTLREGSGLAISSRNARLSEVGKIKAANIFQCLTNIKENSHNHSFETLKNNCIQKLLAHNIETEYLSLANAINLSPMNDFDIQTEQVVLFAGYLENVRLIDNMRIH